MTPEKAQESIGDLVRVWNRGEQYNAKLIAWKQAQRGYKIKVVPRFGRARWVSNFSVTCQDSIKDSSQ